MIKNTTDIAFNDIKLKNIKFVKVNCQPAGKEHLTPKKKFDTAIDEISLVRIVQDNDFNKFNRTKINSITLNTQAVIDNQATTKAYVDQFHQEKEQSRQDVGLDFYDESNGLLKKTINMISTIMK